MARKNRRQDKARERQQEAAWKLCIVGLAFLTAPLFLGKSPISIMMVGLRPIAFLMLLAGGVLLWLGRRKTADETVDFSGQVVKSSGLAKPRVANEPGFDALTNRASAKAVLTVAQKLAHVRPTSWSLETLKCIEWRRFEALIEALFEQAGFETKTQSHGADNGVDIWLYSRNQPGQAVSIVQCKHWSNKVGVDKLRELRGVMAAYKVPRGQFVTTATYSDEALQFAKENSINALDAQGVLALISKRTSEQQQALLDVALEGEYWRPTCVNCGIKLIERSPRAGGKAFWGCRNYPQCKTTMQMR